MDPSQLRDDDFLLYRARNFAAALLRSQANERVAELVEAGRADGDPLVELGLWWHRPRSYPGDDFCRAWDSYDAQHTAIEGQ